VAAVARRLHRGQPAPARHRSQPRSRPMVKRTA
jgi:hypothetical protein